MRAHSLRELFQVVSAFNRGQRMRQSLIYRLPFSDVILLAEDDWLIGLNFVEPQAPPPQICLDSTMPVLQQVVADLEAYLINPQHSFSVAYRLSVGTPFQRQVWQAIEAIPAGQVKTYSQIAQKLHTAPRPIGGACGANPIPLVIPCHRVVAQNGLGGFNRSTPNLTINIKTWLLKHEGVL